MKKNVLKKLNNLLFVVISFAMFFCASIFVVNNSNLNFVYSLNNINDTMYQKSQYYGQSENKNLFENNEKNETNNGQEDDLNTEQDIVGKTIEIEYLIYDKEGQYKTIDDDNLTKYFCYGDDVELNLFNDANYIFVGWFGFDELDNNIFDAEGNEYSSIFDDNLTSANAIYRPNEDVLKNICIFDQPIQEGEYQIYGKLTLVAKCNIDVVISIQSENENYEYVDNIVAGVVKIDSVSSNNQLSVTKSVDIGSSVLVEVSSNENYVFLGLYLNSDDSIVRYDAVVDFDTTLQTSKVIISDVNIDTKSLIARFAYKSSLVSLNKILIDENNSNNKIKIGQDNEYIVDAKLISNNTVLTGVQNLTFVDDMLLLRYGESVELDINPDMNYHLTDSWEKCSLTEQKDIEVSFDDVDKKLILIIKNTDGAGIFDITVFMQKNYNTATLVYGQNQTADDFVGADSTFKKEYNNNGNITHNVFDLKTIKSQILGDESIVSKTANVYFGTDIEIEINTRIGYKFDEINSLVSYIEGLDVQYEYVYQNGVAKSLKIYNVVGKLNIKFSFIKLIKLEFDTNTVSYGGQEQNVGGIKVESESNYNSKTTIYIDGGASLNFEISNPIDENIYEFDKLIIKDIYGVEIDYNLYGIEPNSLENQPFLLSNIYEDLYITANYKLKDYTIRITLTGTNGTIETLENYQQVQGDYIVHYNDTITFKVTPDEKYVIDKLYLQTGNGIRNNFDTYSTYQIQNVQSNQRFFVTIVPDTWTRHITNYQLEGNGTSDSPYCIKDVNDLALVGYLIENQVAPNNASVEYNKAYYQLKNDVDVGDKYFFTPIGTVAKPFSGTFDYNYFAINNLVVEDETKEYINDGLFEIIDGSAKIIRRYKTTLPLKFGLVSMGIVVLIAFVIVVRIEVKRQRPKKVFVLQIDDERINLEKK